MATLRFILILPSYSRPDEHHIEKTNFSNASVFNSLAFLLIVALTLLLVLQETSFPLKKSPWKLLRAGASLLRWATGITSSVFDNNITCSFTLHFDVLS